MNNCNKINSGASSLLVTKPKVKEESKFKKIKKFPKEQVWFAS